MSARPIPTKVANLQALRAIAALAVIVVHLYNLETTYLVGAPWLRWVHIFGSYGVDLFFVISGCIILMTTWDEFGSHIAAGRFLIRRFVRIYPIYWLASIVMLAVFVLHPASLNPHSTARPNILLSFLILPQSGEPLVLVGWTLVYEVFFCVVFAAAMILRRRALLWVNLAWLAAILIAGDFFNAQIPFVRVISNPINLEFIFGVAIGVAIMRGWRRGAWWLLSAGCVLLFILFVWTARLPTEYVEFGWWRPFVVGLPMAAIVLGAIDLEISQRRTAGKTLQRLGDASYSTYLWHVPIISVVALAIFHLHRHLTIMHPLLIICAYAAVIPISVLLYERLERPILRRLRNLQNIIGGEVVATTDASRLPRADSPLGRDASRRA